jgi:segregation and condensation protein B
LDEDRKYLKGLLEALVFLSAEPIKLASLAKTVEVDKTIARELLDELILDYQEREGGFHLREIAGLYQFISSDKYHERLGVIFKEKRRETLSRSNLDTLAIVAYKQPITLAEIDEIRGVSSRAMVANLMSKKLVKPVGQKEVPGRPTLYGTTNDFLIHFGLSKLADLPSPVDVKELRFEELDINLEEEAEMEQEPKLDEDELIDSSIAHNNEEGELI